MPLSNKEIQADAPEGNEVPANLSILCISLIDEILLRAENEGLQHNEDLIHQVRVLTKRLRAAWNLLRDMIPIEKVKQRRTALREVSAHFSGSRDQAVLKSLCNELAEGRTPDEEHALQSIGAGIQLLESDQLVSPTELAELLEEERRAWLALDWSNEDQCRELLNQGLEKSFRKARKTTKRARKSICSEAWHDWRKAIKQLRYQGEFLAELEARPPTDFEIGINELGSLLGQRNDLANLEKYVDSKHPGKIQGRASIDLAVDESTRRIMKKCRKMGKALFRKEPEDSPGDETPPPA